MRSIWNHFNTLYKYSFNLNSYVTENTTILHYKHPLLNVLLNTVAVYSEQSHEHRTQSFFTLQQVVKSVVPVEALIVAQFGVQNVLYRSSFKDTSK